MIHVRIVDRLLIPSRVKQCMYVSESKRMVCARLVLLTALQLGCRRARGKHDHTETFRYLNSYNTQSQHTAVNHFTAVDDHASDITAMRMHVIRAWDARQTLRVDQFRGNKLLAPWPDSPVTHHSELHSVLVSGGWCVTMGVHHLSTPTKGQF